MRRIRPALKIVPILAAVFLFAFTAVLALWPSGASVFAGTSKTLTVTYEAAYFEGHHYGGSYTVSIDGEDYKAFCAQAESSAPTNSSLEVTVSVYEITDSYVRAAMYFGKDGPAEIDGVTEYGTHQCVSWYFSGQTTLSSLTGEYAQLAGIPALMDYVEEHADEVPNSFSVYYCYPAGTEYQAIAWWEYEPEGYLDIKKVSAYAKITSLNSNYSLKGAQYAVYTDSSCKSQASDTSGNEAVFTLDASGNADALALEPGKYYVKETSAPAGYMEDETVYSVTVESEETAWVNSGSVADVPVAAKTEMLLLKQSSETDASLNVSGAVYKLSFYYESDASGTAARIWYLETDDDGYIKLSAEYLADGYESDDFYLIDSEAVLPLGSISLQEEEAPEGFLLDENVYTASVSLSSAGEAEIQWVQDEFLAYSSSGYALHYETPARSDLYFIKQDADGEGLSYIPFLITRTYTDDEGNEASESQIFVTDENGSFNSQTRAKTADNVNLLNPEEYVCGDSFSGTDEELEQAASYNIWFGDTGSISEESGSLLYGDYVIRELRCEGNEGKTLLTKTFTVSSDGKTTDYETELITVTMVNLDIDIDTNAINPVTGKKTISAAAGAAAADAVTLDNLSSNAVYMLFVDFVDEEGNSAGSAWSETFSAEKTGHAITVTVEAELDTSSYSGGGSVTALVYLYQETDGEFYEIARHADTDDEDEKLYLPSMSTTAMDADTKTNTGTHSASASVIDTVEYENLDEGESYRLIATLVDEDGNVYGSAAEDFEIFADTRLNRLKGRQLSSGTIVMPEITLDSSNLSDVTLYVNEALYRIDVSEDGEETETLIIDHDSVSVQDAAQSIYYSEVQEETQAQTSVEETSAEEETAAEEESRAAPETGDESNLAAWIVIAIFAAAGFAGLMIYGFKIKKGRKTNV